MAIVAERNSVVALSLSPSGTFAALVSLALAVLWLLLLPLLFVSAAVVAAIGFVVVVDVVDVVPPTPLSPTQTSVWKRLLPGRCVQVWNGVDVNYEYNDK